MGARADSEKVRREAGAGVAEEETGANSQVSDCQRPAVESNGRGFR